MRIYLRDHEAAAVGGLQLFRRCAKANQTTQYAAGLERLTIAVQADRDALRNICVQFNVRFSNARRAIAYAGATLVRVKTNGRVFKYSPLSRVIELEALSAGVMSKLRLWESLLRVAHDERRLDAPDLERRIADAHDQLMVLKGLHDEAGDEAFKPPPGK